MVHKQSRRCVTIHLAALVIAVALGAQAPVLAQLGSSSHRIAAERLSHVLTGGSLGKGIQKILGSLEAYLNEELPKGVSRERIRPILAEAEAAIRKSFDKPLQAEIEFFVGNASEAELTDIAETLATKPIQMVLAARFELLTDTMQYVEMAFTDTLPQSEKAGAARAAVEQALFDALECRPWIDDGIKEGASDPEMGPNAAKPEVANSRLTSFVMSHLATGLTDDELRSVTEVMNTAAAKRGLQLQKESGERADTSQSMTDIGNAMVRATEKVRALKP